MPTQAVLFRDGKPIGEVSLGDRPSFYYRRYRAPIDWSQPFDPADKTWQEVFERARGDACPVCGCQPYHSVNWREAPGWAQEAMRQGAGG